MYKAEMCNSDKSTSQRGSGKLLSRVSSYGQALAGSTLTPPEVLGRSCEVAAWTVTVSKRKLVPAKTANFDL